MSCLDGKSFAKALNLKPKISFDTAEEFSKEDLKGIDTNDVRFVSVLKKYVS